MSRKLLAIVSALLIAASLCACNNGGNEGSTENGTIDINNETNQGNGEPETNEQGDEIGPGTTTEIGDPGEYSYTECNETVYVNNPDSAVTLRSATYEAMDSIKHGTELTRIGLSTDSANYWSKVIYQEKEYYVASKFLTDIKDADEGFVEVSKTVTLNETNATYLNIRNVPSMNSSVIGSFKVGDEIKVVAENTTTGWYKVEYTPYGTTEVAYGYVASDAKYYVQDEAAETDPAEDTGDAETEPSAGK